TTHAGETGTPSLRPHQLQRRPVFAAPSERVQTFVSDHSLARSGSSRHPVRSLPHRARRSSPATRTGSRRAAPRSGWHVPCWGHRERGGNRLPWRCSASVFLPGVDDHNFLDRLGQGGPFLLQAGRDAQSLLAVVEPKITPGYAPLLEAALGPLGFL